MTDRATDPAWTDELHSRADSWRSVEPATCARCKHDAEAHDATGCSAYKGNGNWCHCKEMVE